VKGQSFGPHEQWAYHTNKSHDLNTVSGGYPYTRTILSNPCKKAIVDSNHSQMPARILSKSRRRDVHVKKMAVPLRFSAQQSSSRLEEIIPGQDRIEELSDEEPGSDYEDMGTATVEEQANIAYLESIRIPIKDSLMTQTSEVDDETAKLILPYLEGNPNGFSLNNFGIPKLQRQRHEVMLKKIIGDYPAGAAPMDAARPWIVYWSLQSMTALGIDISGFQKR
jgi:hypothetical protein